MLKMTEDLGYVKITCVSRLACESNLVWIEYLDAMLLKLYMTSAITNHFIEDLGDIRARYAGTDKDCIRVSLAADIKNCDTSFLETVSESFILTAMSAPAVADLVSEFPAAIWSKFVGHQSSLTYTAVVTRTLRGWMHTRETDTQATEVIRKMLTYMYPFLGVISLIKYN